MTIRNPILYPDASPDLQESPRKRNPILNTDGYKHSHYLQYPPGSKMIKSYVEARVDASQEIVHMGSAIIRDKFLNTLVTRENVNEAERIIKNYGLPFNREGWDYIVETHKGRLPVYIQALPDGTVIPGGNLQVHVNNTDVKLPWLTSFLETEILRSIWYPSTTATRSRDCKKNIKKWMEENCDNLDKLPFMLHDFGARGVETEDAAGVGGMGHLVNFLGTDTLSAIEQINRLYEVDSSPGFSIPASEHSTITSWGRENEIDAFDNMIEQFGGEGKIYACVSDSYNIYEAIEKLWASLDGKIKEKGGTLVIRPDSGEPTKMVMDCLELCGSTFGFTTNTKGFKVLPDHIRLIQGDGVSPEMINKILRIMSFNGWSADNIAFGMGAELLQKVNRDTYKYAMKACSMMDRDGNLHDVFKNPITASGKSSKRGDLEIYKDESGKISTEPFIPGRETMTENIYSSYKGDVDISQKDSWSSVVERAKL